MAKACSLKQETTASGDKGRAGCKRHEPPDVIQGKQSAQLVGILSGSAFSMQSSRHMHTFARRQREGQRQWSGQPAQKAHSRAKDGRLGCTRASGSTVVLMHQRTDNSICTATDAQRVKGQRQQGVPCMNTQSTANVWQQRLSVPAGESTGGAQLLSVRLPGMAWQVSWQTRHSSSATENITTGLKTTKRFIRMRYSRLSNI